MQTVFHKTTIASIVQWTRLESTKSDKQQAKLSRSAVVVLEMREYVKLALRAFLQDFNLKAIGVCSDLLQVILRGLPWFDAFGQSFGREMDVGVWSRFVLSYLQFPSQFQG